MTTTPRVTVLMAVHNGMAFVRAATDSILRQTFTDFELLIVDDGSTDRTVAAIDAARDCRIRLVRQDSNRGLTKSLNHGLALARGQLIARQDADDLSYPERLERQVRHLDAAPGVAAIGTQARTINAAGSPMRAAAWPKSTGNRAIRWQLLFDSPFVHTSVMFRRALIAELGGYDERFITSQDFELWSRVARAGHQLENLADVLVDFRLHGGSLSSSSYGVHNVARLHAVLLQNLVAQLGEAAVPADWPDVWIRVNNPQAYPGATDSPATVAAALMHLYGWFLRLHPDSQGDAEIRRHLAAMLTRVATAGAARGWTSSVRPFVHACSLAPAIAVGAAPRFAARLAAGVWRRPAPARRRHPPR